MTLKSAKTSWKYLKKEYDGDGQNKGMQLLNLIGDFELQKMKESKTIREYFEQLLCIANRVRLLSTEFNDSRIVEKMLLYLKDLRQP